MKRHYEYYCFEAKGFEITISLCNNIVSTISIKMKESEESLPEKDYCYCSYNERFDKIVDAILDTAQELISRVDNVRLTIERMVREVIR